MKNNFSENEVSSIKSVFSNDFNVRVNKCGNIELAPINSDNNEFFVLYLTPNKRYLWRRFSLGLFGYKIFPLNMRNRYRTGDINSYTYNGKIYKYYSRNWDIRNCEFDTVNESIDYFKNYVNKYHKNYHNS